MTLSARRLRRGWGALIVAAMPEPKTVALFVTCLVDFFRPEVGFAAADLVRATGAEIVVPPAQTCCGQPAHNAGDAANARKLARRTIALLEPFETIVVPSGSCAGMIRLHYPELFPPGSEWRGRAERLAGKCCELVEYLAREGFEPGAGTRPASIAYHDSCSALRELKQRDAPRSLLAKISGIALVELEERDSCCGFGGTFCVKYPEISERILADKVADIANSGAACVTSADLGCLLNIAGRLKREGSAIEVRHVAEILAGARGPAIGDS